MIRSACITVTAAVLGATALAGCAGQNETQAQAAPASPPQAAPAAKPAPPPVTAATALATPWLSLFDGKTLGDWQVTQFGTQSDVEVIDGALVVRFGDGLSGVSWSKPEAIPHVNYEIQLQARRTDGVDFFCGLTFPFNDSAGTLVCGGWGGALVGISSIDGQDAAHNETSSTYSFDDNRWYTIRLRVTAGRITAWIDKDKVVDVKVGGRKISLRGDIELAAPLGLSTWCTTGSFRDIKLRKLAAGEIGAK